MRKLIVIAIILLAATCWADMPTEIFKMTNTIDVSSLKKDNPDNDKFGITKSTADFKKGVTEYFDTKKDFFVVKDWELVGDSSYCMAATNLIAIFAICIDDRTVVIKEIK
jgi:hypothetical protein